MNAEQKPTAEQITRAIAKLVEEGRAVYAIVDGKPGLRLTDAARAKGRARMRGEKGK
jgi:hypothetical protein